MLRIRNVSKKIGATLVLDNITFSLTKGEILGLLGNKGVGKTTALAIIAGLLTPSAGIIQYDDYDLVKTPELAKVLIGYLPEGLCFYQEMKVISFLQFIADIHGLSKQEKFSRLAHILNKIPLTNSLEKRIKALSASDKCKLAIAQTLLHNPEILILDEPTAKLDSDSKSAIYEIIKVLAKDLAVIIATQDIVEVERLCDRVAVIADGKIMTESTPQILAEQSPFHNTILIRVTQTPASANMVEILSSIEEIARIERLDSKSTETSLRIYPRNKFIPLSRLSQFAEDLGWEILDLHAAEGRLEDVFRIITTRYQVA